MNFVIYAPGDYTPNGGGCVALHKLAHNIALCGENSFIMTSKKNPDYLGEQVTEMEATILCKDGAMAIYPEVTIGNPFGASKVMRWILYHVRTYGEFGMFGANDLIYKYADHFTLRNEQPTHGELRAVELNLNVFYDKGLERSGDCYLIKKGNNKEHNRHLPGAIKLDDYPSRGLDANNYLANVFNTCKRFISYDSASWLSIMAAQCGCESIVIPDEGVTAEQWLIGLPYFRFGIAYGENELPYAEETKHLLKPALIEIENETLNQTLEFIKKAKKL